MKAHLFLIYISSLFTSSAYTYAQTDNINISTGSCIVSDVIHNDLKSALKDPEQVRHLNLSLNNLKKHSLNKLSHFKNLISLDLSYNDIKILPESILECTHLKKLNLSNNPIQSLPEEISKLLNLEELVMQNTLIEGLPESLFDLNLKKLNFASKYSVITLSNNLLRLDSLEQLECSVSIQEFHDIILKMDWINSLTIHVDSFVSPCSIIEVLTNIEKFNLVLDIYTTYEPVECSFKNLTKLHSFGIIYEDCCWPYIDVSKEEFERIKSLLPHGCTLEGLIVKTGIKDTIELR